MPSVATGKVDNWPDILREAEKIEGEGPGDVFRYSPAVTEVSVLTAEKIDDMTWAEKKPSRPAPISRASRRTAARSL